MSNEKVLIGQQVMHDGSEATIVDYAYTPAPYRIWRFLLLYKDGSLASANQEAILLIMSEGAE